MENVIKIHLEIKLMQNTPQWRENRLPIEDNRHSVATWVHADAENTARPRNEKIRLKSNGKCYQNTPRNQNCVKYTKMAPQPIAD